MAPRAVLYLRVPAELRRELVSEAEAIGLSVSAYAALLLAGRLRRPGRRQ